MAVFNGTTPFPTVDCEQIGKSEWSCEEPQRSCSVLEFKTCKLITQYTDNGVFSMDLADAIYIASTHTVKIEIPQLRKAPRYDGKESFSSFVRSLKNYMNAYLYTEDRDALATRDAILKSTFINGLQEEIGHHVQREMPRDAEHALQAAKREESLQNISITDSLTTAINKWMDQVAAMDNRSLDQVNYIQSNGPQNNWNQIFNCGPGSNRGRGHFRGNHHNRVNSNYRGNSHRGNHQDHVNSQY
ncbi:unnamed protein product [Caenorhabditis nigoni]